jgi:hypothetical protein
MSEEPPMTTHKTVTVQERLSEANFRELIALLRREGKYSGVWFADKLLLAADLLSERERLADAARNALLLIEVSEFPDTGSLDEDAIADELREVLTQLNGGRNV